MGKIRDVTFTVKFDDETMELLRRIADGITPAAPKLTPAVTSPPNRIPSDQYICATGPECVLMNNQGVQILDFATDIGIPKTALEGFSKNVADFAEGRPIHRADEQKPVEPQKALDEFGPEDLG